MTWKLPVLEPVEIPSRVPLIEPVEISFSR